jgi:putative heme transporter
LSLSFVLLTYTAGMATSSLSPLPAGIGLVDGAMVLALTAGGVPAATALPVVLLYRLISVGAVVVAGWCIAALRPGSNSPQSPAAA